MAAGREVLKVLEEEQLQQNCLKMGNLFMSGLKDLRDKHEAIGDVRGVGLMIGLEVVSDKETNNPDQKMFECVFERSKEYGLLMGKGGRYGNVMRIQPPMCINSFDVEFALDVLDKSFSECSK